MHKKKGWLKVVLRITMILVLSLSPLLTWTGTSPSYAEGALLSEIPDDHVRVHYKRLDGNYEGWGLHLWNQDPSSPAIESDSDFSSPVLFDETSEWGDMWTSLSSILKMG